MKALDVRIPLRIAIRALTFPRRTDRLTQSNHMTDIFVQTGIYVQGDLAMPRLDVRLDDEQRRRLDELVEAGARLSRMWRAG